MICISFLILTAIAHYISLNDFHIEKVDCFDENNHKINELTCDKKVTNPSTFKTIWKFSIALTIISGIVSINNLFY